MARLTSIEWCELFFSHSNSVLRLRPGQVLETPDLLIQLSFLGSLLSLLLSSAVLKDTGLIVQQLAFPFADLAGM